VTDKSQNGFETPEGGCPLSRAKRKGQGRKGKRSKRERADFKLSLDH